MTIVSREFTIDMLAGPRSYFGWTDGTRWNGFANPLFDEVTSDRIVRDLLEQNKLDEHGRYEVEKRDDGYYLWYWEDSVKPDEPEIMPLVRDVNGREFYHWGWGWCWYDVTTEVSSK